MPVFNGGAGLVESVRSCAAASLDARRYELIIVDNGSTDGVVDGLPKHDPKGAPIHVYRNAENIGRVANWNRAVDLAVERGFRYTTFLFAGDRWIPGNALERLFGKFQETGASIALAPFLIAGKKGEFKRASQRFYVDGSIAVCSPQAFLSKLLESGLFPLGPLQANLYRIDDQHKPIFDATLPTRTDVDATLDFIHNAASPVVIGSAPFLEWRDRPDRFHASMGPGRTIEDYMNTFQRACARTRLPVDYGRAKTRVVLNSIRLMISDAPPRQWPKLMSVIARCAGSTPYRVNLFHFVETLWLRFALGRRLLQFS
jgi:glycosyltransferase involved in cell wall biosynthesis